MEDVFGNWLNEAMCPQTCEQKNVKFSGKKCPNIEFAVLS
jgi:hypothetical protein